MKKIITAILCIAITTFSFAQTSFFAEQQNYYSKYSKVSPSAFIWANKYFEGKNTGITVFALVSKNWGELMAGPNYTFKSKNPQVFTEIGAMIGLENDATPIRGAGYIFFNANPDSTGKRNKGKVQGFLNAEYGGSGYWYLGFITYNVSNTLALGVHAQSYNGVWGPRLQFQKGSLMLYAVGGYNLENKEYGGLSGLRYFF